jgi:hypothetical protein
MREKNHHGAGRIAKTEQARAHQAEVAELSMVDSKIDVAQMRLNPRNPLPGICDLHPKADLHGLAPGCCRKAPAPRPPFHPFCWCRPSSRPDCCWLGPNGCRRRVQDPASKARACLRSLQPADALHVPGTRDRLQHVLQGADPVAVIDAGKHPQHRTLQLDDATARWARWD